ncbi:MAG: MFS transporter, partial [Lentisphaerae bacterium]|nr:MFS transporter [Lentisphaerota bacterium]
FMLIYGGLQLPVGLLVDRWGVVPTFGLGGAFFSVGALIFPLAVSVSGLYLARVLIALGASVIFLSLVKLIDRWFDSRIFAIAMGVLVFFGYSGGLLGTWPLEQATQALGWRLPLLVAGLLGLLFYGLAMTKLWRWQRPLAREGTLPPPPLLAQIQGIVRRSYWIHFSSSINFGIYSLWQAALGKKMLEDCCGLRPSKAAAFIFLMTLISILCNSGIGWLSRLMGDRYRPILIAATALTCAAAVMLVLVTALRAPAPWFVTVLIMLAISNASVTIFNSSIRELNYPQSVGAAMGLNNSLCYLMVALIIMLAGVVMDQFSGLATHTAAAIIYPPMAYCAIGLGCTVLALASMLASWRIKESWRRAPAAPAAPVIT